MKTQLIAIKSFSYAGRALAAGREFEAKGRDARLLVAIGKASYLTRVLVAEPPAPPPALAAAPSAAPEVVAPAPTPAKAKDAVPRKSVARKSTSSK